MKYLNITSIITLILVTTILTAIPAQASTVTQTNCSVASLQGTYRFIAPAQKLISMLRPHPWLARVRLRSMAMVQLRWKSAQIEQEN